MQADRSLYGIKSSVALFLMAAPSVLYVMFEYGIPFQPPLALYREAMPLLLLSVLCGVLGFAYLVWTVWVSLRNR